MKMKSLKDKKFSAGILAGIIVVVSTMIISNAFLVFRMTSKQTEDLGTQSMINISKELDDELSQAEYMIKSLALETEEILKENPSKAELTDFFEMQQTRQSKLSDGNCFNVCYVSPDTKIVPGYEVADDFDMSARVWYTYIQGKNPGEIYISAPYNDLVTGDMCYTVAEVLSDGEAILSLDFNMEIMQSHIEDMQSEGSGQALIVNSDGFIVGYNDSTCVGKKLTSVLPEYKNIFQKIISKNKDSFTLETKIAGMSHTVFFSKTENDWYLILSLNTTKLYKDSYMQLIRNSIVGILLMFGIVVFFLLGRKSQRKAEKAMAAKEEFIENLSEELKSPLQKIQSISRTKSLETEETVNQQMEMVQESAKQLSIMLDNLFSYSNILSAKKKEKDKTKKDKKNFLGVKSKAGIYIQRSVIVLLVLTMIITMVYSARLVLRVSSTEMKNDVNVYSAELSEWVNGQRNIIETLAYSIASNEKLLQDANKTVEYLRQTVVKYKDISSIYIANPNAEHQLIMDTGCEQNSIVQAYQWYVDTMASDEGFSISTPYYDGKAGAYYVTFAKSMYNTHDEWIGILCIDFYLDKLTDKLSQSYSDDGYAFLVNSNGVVVNHPNKDYQLSGTVSANVNDLCYANAFNSNSSKIIRDYDNTDRVCIAKHEEISGFTCILVKNCRSVYGEMIGFQMLFLVLFGLCIGVAIYLIHRLAQWQQEVNEQLEKSRDMAIQADNAKSDFLANMSHEIRTPINAVLGMNEMISRETENENILEYSENIQSAGRTLLSIINEILDFSKIESGKMEIIPVSYDTSTVVMDLIHVIQSRADKKSLKLITDIDENLPATLFGDDVRVRQVITNLLTNAVKYTPQGSVTFRMHLKCVIKSQLISEKDRALIEVSVEDTGIGIREEDLGKLFDSFQRLDEKKNRNIEGTGLGITIVQNLLGMMGSKLNVSSEYGKGSKFSFILDQGIEDGTPIGDFRTRHLTNAVLQEENAKNWTAPKANILVVDDTEMNLKVVVKLLKRTLMNVDTVESGTACIERLREKKYHIVLLDHMMPVMDGIETLEIIKKENLASDTTFIVLTANAIQGVRQKYMDAGFDDYLSKPVTGDVLEAMLRRYLPEDLVLDVSTDNSASADKADDTQNISADNMQNIPADSVASADNPDNTQNTCADNTSSADSDYGKLDIERGLMYCAGSEEFYKEMLQDYLDTDRATELQDLYEKQDLENYRIKVHALKSSSLTLGLTELSNFAKEMEMAAKEENMTYISEHQMKLLEAYRQGLAGIEKYLKE